MPVFESTRRRDGDGGVTRRSDDYGGGTVRGGLVRLLHLECEPAQVEKRLASRQTGVSERKRTPERVFGVS